MLGLIALGIVVATGWIWFQLIERVEIPRNRLGFQALFVSAGVLGLVAISEGGFFSTAFAMPAVAVGFGFPALRLLSSQKPNIPAVAVGGEMLALVAPDENGVDFDLSSLRGKPYLMKFFRGHWWPYCVAELRRWEELRPTLDRKGIALVAISTDTPEQIRAGKDKHGMIGTQLADPDLVVTDQLNLRNPVNLGPKGISGMPIPTTFLVDAMGKVRWIDQTDDYMLRSEPERVLAAIEASIEWDTAP